MGYCRTSADVTRATAAEMCTAAASGVPATTGSMAATTGRMAATTGRTAATAAGMATAAFRGSRVGRARQRGRERNDDNPEFEYRHNFLRPRLARSEQRIDEVHFGVRLLH
jgi:hypothetical protein